MDINGSRAEAHLNLLHRVTVQTSNPPTAPVQILICCTCMWRCRNSHIPPLVPGKNVCNKDPAFLFYTFNHVETVVKFSVRVYLWCTLLLRTKPPISISFNWLTFIHQLHVFQLKLKCHRLSHLERCEVCSQNVTSFPEKVFVSRNN